MASQEHSEGFRVGRRPRRRRSEGDFTGDYGLNCTVEDWPPVEQGTSSETTEQFLPRGEELQRWSPCSNMATTFLDRDGPRGHRSNHRHHGHVHPGPRRPAWSPRQLLSRWSGASWIATASWSPRHLTGTQTWSSQTQAPKHTWKALFLRVFQTRGTDSKWSNSVWKWYWFQRVEDSYIV